MSTETLSQTIGAGAVIQFGGGNNFLILASTSAVDVTAVRLGAAGSRIVLKGALQGFSFKSEDGGGFDLLEVASAAAQNITFVVGDDDVSYPSTVNVAGTVNTVPAPATAVVDQAHATTINGQAALFPQNVSRKRITVFSSPANAANPFVYLRPAGGANNIGTISPGQFLEFDGTYGLDSFATAAGDLLYLFEES